ncbi:MAG: hypothetical protein U1E86_06340 [Burkholderiaceae bacterium]
MTTATITTDEAGKRLHDLAEPLADVLRAIELAIDSDEMAKTDALLRLAARTLRDTGREVEQLVAELGVPPMGEFDEDEVPKTDD